MISTHSRVGRWLLVVAGTALSIACSRSHEPGSGPVDGSVATAGAANATAASPRYQLMTVNYPLLAMAEAIADDLFTLSLPSIPGDPAFWQPDAQTIIRYQQAERILCNGAGYARWLSTASLRSDRLVDTSLSFHQDLIATQGLRHSHGPNAAHDHGAKAFTTWLDMQQATAQAGAIRETMLGLLPGPSHAAERERIEQGFHALQQKLAGYDQRLTAIGQRLADAPILYSHPIYQYLQRAYRLNGHALNWEPNQPPTDVQWQQLVSILEQHQARLMLWEAEPLTATRARLEELGITVVVFSAVANYPSSGDLWSAMESNINTLEQYVGSLD